MYKGGSLTIQPHLEVGEELLRSAVVLSLHDDIRQLVDDDIEGPLRYQRPSEVNLREKKLCNVMDPSSYSDAFLLQSYVNVHYLVIADIKWATSVVIINYQCVLPLTSAQVTMAIFKILPNDCAQSWHSGNNCEHSFHFHPCSSNLHHHSIILAAKYLILICKSNICTDFLSCS